MGSLTSSARPPLRPPTASTASESGYHVSRDGTRSLYWEIWRVPPIIALHLAMEAEAEGKDGDPEPPQKVLVYLHGLHESSVIP